MKHNAFFWFVLPSAAAMVLFIFFPLVSIVIQSFHVAHEQVIIEVENCGPFGCQTATAIDQEATAALREAQPLGQFAGLDIYKDRNHLAVEEFAGLWERSSGLGDFIGRLMNLPFYKALGFTLTYTFVVTPLTILFGFVIAVAVNSAAKALRGPLIFFSLLPNIVTPLIGGLILFWMVDARGVLGNALRWLADDPSLSVKADTGLMWSMLMVYGVWSSAPFAFIVYYAGLQTV
ncbi:MAG TPA: sugar ABC transporter permease, partial [Marivita sp.]|nr:sugar ABC transporter permease [Marivita sp.]